MEKDILPYTEANGITTLAYGALDDIRKDPKFQAPRYAEYLEAVRALSEFAQERYGKTVLALAIRWILDRGHTVALWGARHPSQLDAIPETMGWHLDDDAMKQIDSILAQSIKSPVGPEFMAPPALPKAA